MNPARSLLKRGGQIELVKIEDDREVPLFELRNKIVELA